MCLTTGAASNWEITWWRKAAKWAGLDLSCSILLKQLHWPFVCNTVRTKAFSLPTLQKGFVLNDKNTDRGRVRRVKSCPWTVLKTLYLLLVWIKVVVLSSNDLWDDARRWRTADCGWGHRVLRRRRSTESLGTCIPKCTQLLKNTQTQSGLWYSGDVYLLYQVSCVLCLWWVTGVVAVPGGVLWAGTGCLPWINRVWRSKSKSVR